MRRKEHPDGIRFNITDKQMEQLFGNGFVGVKKSQMVNQQHYPDDENCIVCRKKPRPDGKMTCGNDSCKHEFFEMCIEPDVNEVRTIR